MSLAIAVLAASLSTAALPEAEAESEVLSGAPRTALAVIIQAPEPTRLQELFARAIHRDTGYRAVTSTQGASMVVTATLSQGPVGLQLDVGLEDEKGAALFLRTDLAARDDRQLEAALNALFENELRPIFDRQGLWRPFGIVEIRGAPAGLGIIIDGQKLGHTFSRVTQIIDVPIGARQITLTSDEAAEHQILVQVHAGAVSLIDVTRPVSNTPTVRRVLFWTGVGTAAAGAAIATAALIETGGRPQPACFEGAPGCDDKLVFLSSGASDAGGLTPPSNPPGFLIAPFGFSLLAAGLSWSVGTAMYGRKDDVPWVQVVTGVVAAGVVYTASALLRSPSDDDR